MIEAIAHYEAALKEAFPRGATGDVFHHWNEARKALEQAEKQRFELIGHADLSINNIYIFSGYGEEVPEGRTPIYAGYKKQQPVTRPATREEKIVNPGVYEVPVQSEGRVEPVACKTLCEFCVKRGYDFCANAVKTTPIQAPTEPAGVLLLWGNAHDCHAGPGCRIAKRLTTPPAAHPALKPLTDEQIGMAFRKAFPVGAVVFTNGAIAFARAIEAAHGITGETE